MTQSPGRPGIGLNLPTWPRADGTLASWPEMRALARDAEALGVDRLWVADHLVQVTSSGRVIDFRECWTVLAATAEATSRIGVGPLVTCAGYRNPGLLARMADTLDMVSGGRLVLAAGPGDVVKDTSWRAFGFDDRRPVGRFAEWIEVVARLLRGETVTFTGEHVRTEGASLGAQRADRARIPVWGAAIGKRTMDIAARWADAVNVNLAMTSADDVRSAAGLATAACRRVGRDPATLELTGWTRIALDPAGHGTARAGWLAGSPDEMAQTLRAMAAEGMRHLSVYIGTEEVRSPLPALTPRALERFVPLLEALRIP